MLPKTKRGTYGFRVYLPYFCFFVASIKRETSLLLNAQPFCRGKTRRQKRGGDDEFPQWSSPRRGLAL